FGHNPEKSQENTQKRYLNYFLDIATLPNLTLSQALGGSIVNELVAGKVVLIDLDYHQNQTPLFIPQSAISQTQAGNTATQGQLQALAAHTLLTGSDIRQLPIAITLALLLVVYTSYFFVLQLLSPKGTFVFGVVLSVLTYWLAMLVLVNWHVLLPVFELIVIQVFAVVYLLGIERLRKESSLLKMSAELNARLSKKVQPPSFYQSENPWDNLHALINQQLNLHRSIFLAKVPKDHRVVAIHALNCSIDDIQEMRRDYQRAPYSVAIATQKPIKLTKQYFDSVDESEIEYMCPLIFSGNVLGFWALTVMPDKDWHQGVFENNLIQFVRESTELLFHRNRYLKKSNQENALLRRIFSLQLAQAEHQSLDNSVSMLEKRFDSLQYVFDGMSTASTLYSLFGQIVHSNRQMEALVKQWQLPLYNLSAHDFLLKITLLDSAQIKQKLLQVTIHNVEVSLSITIENQPTDYILRVRPIDVPNDNKEEGIPFLLLGILFEFIDISEAQQVLSMKQDLYSQYFHQMRNNLGTLNLISRQLRSKLGEGHPLLGMLDETLNECTKVNISIEDQLAKQRTQVANVVPVNPFTEWQKVTESASEEISKKHIQLNEDVPSIMSLVLAEPVQLATVLGLICTILTQDSDSNESTLSLTVKDTTDEQNERIILMTFGNEGYGVPDDHMARLLAKTSGDWAGSDEPLEKLLLAADNAQYWGLKLTISSTLGTGYAAQLTIPVFVIN
ncbi:MAG: hypothetical protein HRT35_35855, partial [Algicola sp.]|nr:hypothetical protein [Algicola sp.]